MRAQFTQSSKSCNDRLSSLNQSVRGQARVTHWYQRVQRLNTDNSQLEQDYRLPAFPFERNFVANRHSLNRLSSSLVKLRRELLDLMGRVMRWERRQKWYRYHWLRAPDQPVESRGEAIGSAFCYKAVREEREREWKTPSKFEPGRREQRDLQIPSSRVVSIA